MALFLGEGLGFDGNKKVRIESYVSLYVQIASDCLLYRIFMLFPFV